MSDDQIATCSHCGRAPGFDCRAHFVKTIDRLHEALDETVVDLEFIADEANLADSDDRQLKLILIVRAALGAIDTLAESLATT